MVIFAGCLTICRVLSGLGHHTRSGGRNYLKFIEMPKMKTNSAAKKRFDFTGTGKIKRKHAYHSHILTKKTTKQKRNLDYSALVAPADEAKVKSLLVK